jgi:ADP-ribosylglycohydrolase
MKGAIIGDIIGSAFIGDPLKAEDAQLFCSDSSFTDDTILTLSTADAILNNLPYEQTMRSWVQNFPKAGYRQEFLNWALSEKHEDYISVGNGAARRISPIGFSSSTLEKCLSEAEKTTRITHNVDIRIRASRAYAGCIFLAREGESKKAIKAFAEKELGMPLDSPCSVMQKKYADTEPVPTPVISAFSAFWEGSTFEDTIRRAIWIGGPSNTIASIAGGIAQAYYKHIPKSFIRKALTRLTPDMIQIISDFDNAYMKGTDDIREIVFNVH